MTTSSRLFWLAAILMAALLCTSCGDGRKPVYPARGQVFFEGKPTPGALVIFHPLNDPDPNAMHPLARVEADGSFALTTYQGKDGAPAGEYTVTVSWVRDVDRQNLTAEEQKKEEPNLLPDRYSNSETSGLRAEIKKGPNELPPFQLKRQ